MSYTPNTWQSGDIITAAKLNHIEDGIANAGGISGIDEPSAATMYGNIGVERNYTKGNIIAPSQTVVGTSSGWHQIQLSNVNMTNFNNANFVWIEINGTDNYIADNSSLSCFFYSSWFINPSNSNSALINTTNDNLLIGTTGTGSLFTIAIYEAIPQFEYTIKDYDIIINCYGNFIYNNVEKFDINKIKQKLKNKQSITGALYTYYTYGTQVTYSIYDLNIITASMTDNSYECSFSISSVANSNIYTSQSSTDRLAQMRTETIRFYIASDSSSDLGYYIDGYNSTIMDYNNSIMGFPYGVCKQESGSGKSIGISFNYPYNNNETMWLVILNSTTGNSTNYLLGILTAKYNNNVFNVINKGSNIASTSTTNYSSNCRLDIILNSAIGWRLTCLRLY